MKKTKTHLGSDIVCSFSSALNLVALAKKSQSCVRYASGVKIDNLVGLPQDLQWSVVNGYKCKKLVKGGEMMNLARISRQ